MALGGTVYPELWLYLSLTVLKYISRFTQEAEKQFYSQICRKRPPLGARKSGLLRQMYVYGKSGIPGMHICFHVLKSTRIMYWTFNRI